MVNPRETTRKIMKNSIVKKIIKRIKMLHWTIFINVKKAIKEKQKQKTGDAESKKQNGRRKSTLSIITVHVNGLNSPVRKAETVTLDQNKIHAHAIQGGVRQKYVASKRMTELHHAHKNRMKARVVMLISDEVSFKTKNYQGN